MAFWLASERRDQQSSFIQRFDPRFWTVNFPRPAMASVITTGPDGLRVDCEFHHRGELVGLIWESADSLDHPLLAYATSRDYSRTTLQFRWCSDGLIALDAVNGPTLTIEGRDAAGNARSWFVRLWNYASGTPTDAQITLPFSELEGGWFLPGDPVHPGDIDRMFISLVPPGFAGGSSLPLAARANGYAELSGISCDGAEAMLEIGDVIMPVHGERIATAYDDLFNQTPARILRNIEGLGYRDELVHYAGMSHFMRLGDAAAGVQLVAQPAQLAAPASQWHQNFLSQARARNFSVIVSLSYELFNQYCPDSWKQRALDGEIALTGWVPPSTLLSPSNNEAMGWLGQAASLFVGLLVQEQLPVRFQIGEPWWWVSADRRPCIYDDAARLAYGTEPPIITDLGASLGQNQFDYLDFVGTELARSTFALRDTVRNAASGPAEILLLTFTPAIFDPAMPELHRANMPPEWAFPAFDRLQIEDYDWLTGGAEAQRRAAYVTVDQMLGYPPDRLDYFSGFVLSQDEAQALWRRIDHGLDEARKRGVARRFVWALPQVNRDGYTRLPVTMEDGLQAFDDVLYPFALGRGSAVSPEFSTSVAITASGHERRNSLWSDARLHFDVGPGIRSELELGELIAFFRARRGAARGFRIRDPFDHSSNGMSGAPTMNDQLLGIGDGLRGDFQLVKHYGQDGDPQVRRITRPRIETIVASVSGVPVSNWSLEPGGVLSFAWAPPQGAEVRAGFLFDVPVRFEEDRIDISGVNFEAGEAPSIPLVEIREAQ